MTVDKLSTTSSDNTFKEIKANTSKLSSVIENFRTNLRLKSKFRGMLYGFLDIYPNKASPCP